MERNSVRRKQNASKNPELGVSQNVLFFFFGSEMALWRQEKIKASIFSKA